jgi:tRNA (guanine-N7-)-methyltransferase
MPRRSLRPIDPELDLSRHLLAYGQLPSPWDSAVLFARDAPLEIEVGSGKGLFLSAAATGDPDANFLGIEIARKYARYSAARLARRELPNAKLLNADAERLFRELLPAGASRAVHVYFPDPWWKARHRKRRVMNPSFLGEVERVLADSGRLHFWTDVEEYFQTTLELIARESKLVGPREVPEQPAMHDLDFRTHFERRMRMNGLPVYRAVFDKPADRRT